MKTAPKFKGRRADNGEWVEGDVVNHRCGRVSIRDNPARYGYGATEGFGHLVDPTTVEQIGGDLFDENASLREWKSDVEDSHKRIMSEQCPTDEVHCTCVPILRKENASLKRQLDDASKALQYYQSSPCYDVAFENGCRAVKQKYAAENAELKAKLETEQKLFASANSEVARSWKEADELKDKLAEFERLIREGELIRVHVAENYVQELVKSIANEFGYNHHLCAETLIDDLKGYAASKQKEGGE